MNRLASHPACATDARAILLSGVTFLLTLPLLTQVEATWLTQPPGIVTIVATMCLTASLYLSLLKRDALARLLLGLASVSLASILFWRWREVLASLMQLRQGVVGVYVITSIGYVIQARLRSVARVRLQSALLISALPVALVCSVYLLLAAASETAPENVRLLIGLGLSITYFNLGATMLGGGRPLDGGQMLPDGERLLGDGKTWQGSAGGLLLATLAFAIFAGSPGTGLLVAVIAFLGDAIASFLKRRLGQRRSCPVPFLDQWDGLLLLLLLTSGLGSPVLLPPDYPPILLVGTLFIQFSGNRILFGLGKKSVPW